MSDAALLDLRPYMFSIAYRMLGTVSDAEDVVQEAWLRMAGHGDVDHPKAYAATVTTRISVDMLRSARVRRESYVGDWFPEPLLTSEAHSDPAHRVERDETISTAWMILLESLSPAERAAFVLHDVFDYPYPEVAEILDRSEPACRQLVARARRNLDARRPRYEADPARVNELARAFFAACAAGDVDQLRRLLTDDVEFHGDGGGKAPAVLHPVVGQVQVIRFLLGLIRQGTRMGFRFEPVEVNGQPGALLLVGDQRLVGVMSLEFSEGRIVRVRNLLNPDKLRHLHLPIYWAAGDT